MAIKDWHPGQLVIIWISGLSLGGVVFGLGQITSTEYENLGIAIALAAVLGTPIALLVVTWKWFGGRPR